jgi:hypothetical protein
VREPEILKAVLAAWNGIATALTVLPGGLHEYVADDDNTPPAAEKWATVRVTEGALARMTNGGPIREHTLTVDVYDTTGTDGLTGNATLLHTLGTIPSVINKSLDNGGTIIDLWPTTAPQGGQTDQTRAARGVNKLSIAWRVQSRWDY